MFSLVTRLKVLGISISSTQDAAEDDKEAEAEAGLRIIAKTKWSPNVVVPLMKTIALPTYTCSLDQELFLFLEVWDKQDNEYGLDKLLGLAQYDLKEKFLKCRDMKMKQEYRQWLQLRNPVSNKVGGKALVIIQVDEHRKNFESGLLSPGSSYFPEPNIQPSRETIYNEVTTGVQSKTREEVIRAAQLQLESLGITPTASPDHSVNKKGTPSNNKSPGSVQVDDIIQILNGKIGNMVTEKESKNNKNRVNRGQGDISNPMSKISPNVNFLKSGNHQSQPQPSPARASTSSAPKVNFGKTLVKRHSEPRTNNKPNQSDSHIELREGPSTNPSPRRRIAAVFTNMDYL